MKKIKSVLLIDDDYVTNFTNESLIVKFNMAESVSIFTSPVEALEKLTRDCETAQRQPVSFPELILLDINMPVMNGFEFLEKFERLPCKDLIKVVLLTSSAHPQDLVKARNFNIAGYIDKPLNTDKMHHIFSRVRSAS